MAEVANTDVADLLRNVGRSLRLVVLSACQSARTSNNDAYADLARRLMRQGVSAVLSMQYRVLDRAATDFAGRFYTALAHNKPVDVALTEGRLSLRLSSGQAPRLMASAAGEEGGQRVDFATPVLFLNDPACVTVEAIRPVAEELSLDKPLDFGTVSVMEKNFVGRQREMRRIRHGFTRQRKRAFIIHGLGGIGKSVLATRAATKLTRHFHGVKAIKATPTLRPEDVLSELNAFLNLAGINQFNPVIHAPMRLADKTAVLAQILNQMPFLVIFDNFEDVLTKGRRVQEGVESVKRKDVTREGVKRDTDEIADPALAGFFEQLLQGVAKETKFLFTSRYDFDPLGGRLTGEVGHIPLGELPFPMAVQHMNNHDVLALLPVVPPQRARVPPVVGAGVPPAQTGAPAQVLPITKRELYRKLGGHPYAIDVFTRRAAVTTVADALLEIADVEREMIEFTLLDRTYAQLPPRAQTLLMRASVYGEDVPLEGLQWMLGDQREAMPAVDAELRALLGWGMLARKEVGDEVVYPMHALVRDYARRRRADSAEEERALLLRAAKFWELQGQQSRDLGDWLRAREYYYRAGEYEKADEIVGYVYGYLVRWGYLELISTLLNGSIQTLAGTRQAVAFTALAGVHQSMGDYETAIQHHSQALRVFEKVGDFWGVAVVLHNLGMIHQDQGDYAEAQARYEQSLAISRELGAKSGIASSLHNLGRIHQDQGDYAEAQARYEQSLAISRELGDKNGIANSLHQLGTIHGEQGRYVEAQARHEQSLAMLMEMGNKRGIANSLHQLGMIHYLQGNYAEAQARCEQSLAMRVEIGDKLGIGDSLGAMGTLHAAQGNYPEAQARCEQSLAIKMELGHKRGIATALHQLGMIHEEQESYAEAFEKYTQALIMFEQLGSPHTRTAMGSLARLWGKMGEEAWGEVQRTSGLDGLGDIGVGGEPADLVQTDDWRELAGVLGRVLAGERGRDLLVGLDEVDTAIVEAVLEGLATER